MMKKNHKPNKHTQNVRRDHNCNENEIFRSHCVNINVYLLLLLLLLLLMPHRDIHMQWRYALLLLPMPHNYKLLLFLFIFCFDKLGLSTFKARIRKLHLVVLPVVECQNNARMHPKSMLRRFFPGIFLYFIANIPFDMAKKNEVFVYL